MPEASPAGGKVPMGVAGHQHRRLRQMAPHRVQCRRPTGRTLTPPARVPEPVVLDAEENAPNRPVELSMQAVQRRAASAPILAPSLLITAAH